MSGKIIIADATNLMKQLPDESILSKAAAARMVLEKLHAMYPGAEKIHAVFDGHPFAPSSPSPRIQTHFSFDQSADEVILKLAASHRSRSSVLTRDRTLQAKARGFSAATPEISMLEATGKIASAAKPESDSPWQEKLLKLRFDP